MKRTLPIVVSLLLIGVIQFAPGNVLAQSDNITWVATDNFTVTSDNFTLIITDFTDVAEAHAQILADNQSDITQDILGLVLVIAVTALAYWRRTVLLYALSGLSLLIYGFAYFNTSIPMSIILVIIGVFSFGMGVRERGK